MVSRLLKRLPATAVIVSVVALGVGAAVALSDDNPQPIDVTHNVSDAPAPVADTQWANGPNVQTGTAICATPTQTTANVNTDCETNGPHNETSIAVNPTNTQNRSAA